MPTGTITFLFTDIEGSTRLWEEQPRAMRLALARHDTLLREAIEREGGHVFKTVGDAFCAAFPTAPQAVSAALFAQRALISVDWDGTGPLRARMGLHTGGAEVRDNDYFGPTLNRVARLLSTGYGGQILLSLATQQLVREDLPPGTDLKDLGEALKILGDGTATVPQIDAAMRGAGFKMGPFELMDLIGIDINFAVTRSVYNAFFGEPRYRPHPIQQRMVEAGTLGRKTGQGFYTYRDGEKLEAHWSRVVSRLHERYHPFIPSDLTAEFLRRANITLPAEADGQGEVVVRILSTIINEAAFAAGEGVASVRDIDIAMRLGTNYPEGPLKWADHIGLDFVFNALKYMREALGGERYRPAPLLYHLAKSGSVGDAVGSGFHFPGEKGMV